MMNGCGTCALREMKVLASEYYRFKQQLETKDNKPKRTRKKKEEQ